MLFPFFIVTATTPPKNRRQLFCIYKILRYAEVYLQTVLHGCVKSQI